MLRVLYEAITLYRLLRSDGAAMGLTRMTCARVAVGFAFAPTNGCVVLRDDEQAALVVMVLGKRDA